MTAASRTRPGIDTIGGGRVRTISLLILSLPVAAIGAGGGWLAQPSSRDLVGSYLVERMGFSPADVRAVESGHPVARTVDGHTAEDIAVVGAVHIRTTPATLVARFRDITRFERSDSVLAIGTFGPTPSVGDLAGLTLEPGDLSAVRRCTPGSCDLQLSTDAMYRFRAEVDWQSPKASDEANAVMRTLLLEMLSAYRIGGNDALGQYDDQRPPVRVAEEFRLLGASRDMPVPLAPLAAYLTDYPRVRLRSAEDFFYWSKVDFGLKPTIRLNHVTIYPVPDRRDGLRYAIVTKQLYASHYFSTALEMRFLVEDPGRPGQGFVLLLVTKSRVPGLSGLFGGVIRLVVKGRASGSMERHLDHTRRAAEGK